MNVGLGIGSYVVAIFGILSGSLVPVHASADNQHQVGDVLGFQLGESSIRDVLLAYGPADSAFLTGIDSEGGSQQTSDPVVLRFERSICIKQRYNCQIRAHFHGPDLIAHAVAVMPSSDREPRSCRIGTEEVQAVFGDDFRETRHHWVMDEDEIEGHLSACNDPDGEIPQWSYRDLGVVVTLDETGRYAESLLFSQEIAAQIASAPECDH